MFSSWAVLHGPIVKAANTRHTAPILYELACIFFSSGEAEPTAIRTVCAELCHFYHIIYGAGYFLTASEKGELGESLLILGVNLQRLRGWSHARGEFSWWVSPKVHYAQHFQLAADLINPRFTQCYCEESMMGRISTIWESCASGPYARTIQRAALLRYLTILVIELRL